MLQLKSIHSSNTGSKTLNPSALLNKLAHLNLKETFINVFIALRLFCCLPVSVASGERPFSKLSLIKNAKRSTMKQLRLAFRANWLVNLTFLNACHRLLQKKQKRWMKVDVYRCIRTIARSFNCTCVILCFCGLFSCYFLQTYYF